MDEGKAIFISVNVSTNDDADAAKAIDILSRLVLGLALEGLNTALEVSIENVFGELEYEEEEYPSDGES